MLKRPHHIIFDLDGTLIDSKPEIINTYKQVFSKVVPEKLPDISRIDYGATLQKVMAGVYTGDESRIDDAKRAFASLYDHSEYSETTVYDGVFEVLNSLKQAGYHLYVATNKRRVPTLRILEKKQLNSFFSHVLTTDTDPSQVLSKEAMVATLKKKFHFDEGFMVGDTAQDIEAGRNQNLRTIYVTYGYGAADAHLTSRPAFTISSFKELRLIFAAQPQ